MYFTDTIYTERYMDLPSINVDGYDSSSLLTNEVVSLIYIFLQDDVNRYQKVTDDHIYLPYS